MDEMQVGYTTPYEVISKHKKNNETVFIQRVSDSGMRDREKAKLKMGGTKAPGDVEKRSDKSPGPADLAVAHLYQVKKLKAQLRQN